MNWNLIKYEKWGGKQAKYETPVSGLRHLVNKENTDLNKM